MARNVDENLLRQQMCEIGRRMWQRGWIAANDGNISVRVDHRRVLVTPTGISKGFMEPRMLCLTDMHGKHIGDDSGGFTPTSELKMHLAIYAARPDVNAVVHTHAPHAVAFSIARMPLPKRIYPEVEVLLGDVPLTDYATSGTDEVPDSITPHLTEATRAILMANHGPVTFGATLESAYQRMEVLEAYCRIVTLARQIGEPVQVPET